MDLIDKKIRAVETQIRNKDVSIVKKETPQEETVGEGEALGMHRSVRRFEIYLKVILTRLRVKMTKLIRMTRSIRMRKTRLTLLQRQQFDFNLCGVVITIETEYTN